MFIDSVLRFHRGVATAGVTRATVAGVGSSSLQSAKFSVLSKAELKEAQADELCCVLGFELLRSESDQVLYTTALLELNQLLYIR